MSEVEEIEKRYRRRTADNSGKAARYSSLIVEERERVYKKILERELGMAANKRMIEIGAGNGSNIPFFLQYGFKEQNIDANELLKDRVEAFSVNFPRLKLYPGNVLEIHPPYQYDLVFQSTVFSSILDDGFRKKLAEKMLALAKPGAIILSYDFVYNNPSNKDVKKFTKQDIGKLFSGCKIEFHKVTLAPPVGRRLPALYKVLNTLFPFLRSHLIAVIRKP